MFHSNLLKRTLEGLRIHSGKSVWRSIVQVKESPSTKVIIAKSCCFSRSLLGEGRVVKYTSVWGFFFYFFRGNYSVTREKSVFAEFRPQGRPEFLQHAFFTACVEEHLSLCSLLARLTCASHWEKALVTHWMLTG